MTEKVYAVTLYVHSRLSEDELSDAVCATMEGGFWLLCNDAQLLVVDVSSTVVPVVDSEDGWVPANNAIK